MRRPVRQRSLSDAGVSARFESAAARRGGGAHVPRGGERAAGGDEAAKEFYVRKMEERKCCLKIGGDSLAPTATVPVEVRRASTETARFGWRRGDGTR